VAVVDQWLLTEFKALTEEAAEYRRHSFGAPPGRQAPGAAFKLSRHLLLIDRMVKLHPELNDDYREWRRLYPTFTSD
jgi:hypothetical protein